MLVKTWPSRRSSLAMTAHKQRSRKAKRRKHTENERIDGEKILHPGNGDGNETRGRGEEGTSASSWYRLEVGQVWNVNEAQICSLLFLGGFSALCSSCHSSHNLLISLPLFLPSVPFPHTFLGRIQNARFGFNIESFFHCLWMFYTRAVFIPSKTLLFSSIIGENCSVESD